MSSLPSLLLVGCDDPLVQSIRGAFSGIADIRLKILGSLEDLDTSHPAPIGLLIVQVEGSASVAQAESFLQNAKDSGRPIPTLVLSNQFHAEQAFDFLRLGALEYLSRPYDLARLVYIAQNVIGKQGVIKGSDPKTELVQTAGEETPFIYLHNPIMGQLMTHVHKVAPLPATVLLSGETGTGKTRLARLIHDISPRAQDPFLVVNCGALSANLIESEMFGHIKGAYTGADRDRTGKFAAVGRGTLVLDEIDALPIELQAKLLRVVEERKFEPVGSNQTETVRARFIVASNRDLEQEVGAGRFRSDLYHRLNVVSFCLPPLRELPDLITPLADHFLNEIAPRIGSDVASMSTGVYAALHRYRWPGNIRELRNALERALSLCPGDQIQIGDLPHALRIPRLAYPHNAAAEMASPFVANHLARSNQEIEIAQIHQALQRHNHNRLRAAAELGISRMTLYKKLHRYGMIAPTLNKPAPDVKKQYA